MTTAESAASVRVHDAPSSSRNAVPPHFERLPVAAYACDAEGVLLWFNTRAREMWGREPQPGEPDSRFCGAYAFYTLDGEPVERIDIPMARVLRTGEPVEGDEIVIARPDGERRIARVHIDPVRDESGALVGAINCFHDITDLHEARQDARSQARRLADILQALPTAVYTTDADARITFYNEAAARLWGCRPALGDSQWCGSWRLQTPDGEHLAHEDCPMGIAIRERRAIAGAEAGAVRPDGLVTPFLAYPTPLFDTRGGFIGAVNMLVDITERKRAEARQAMLIAELNHRVKNTLATVQSLAAHGFRNTGSEAGRAAFEGRLFALARTHDRLCESEWDFADLQGLLDDLLAPFAGADGMSGRIRLEGPAVSLTPKTALSLALILNELSTNASKYGALSTPEGGVEIRWNLAGSGETELRLCWREHGGPPVTPPKHEGFGTLLVRNGLPDGETTLSFNPAGLQCDILVHSVSTPA